MEIYKAILDTLVCLAACATGASAVVALVHYLRHWRDDEVKLAVELDHETTETDRDGKMFWGASVVITNTGKVPVTITGFEFVDKSLYERFELDDRIYPDIFLYQGTADKTYAAVRAKESGVAIPKDMALCCKWAKTQGNGKGRFTANETKPSAAR